MKVAGFGEIMLRLSTDVGKMILQSDRFNVNYGGGEANVLISLSHFGIDTKMITSVSNDDIGKSILRYLRSYDIDTEFVTLSDHRTGIYYLQVGSGIRSSKVIYDRDNSAFCNMKIVDIDNNKLSEGLGRCPKYPQGTRPLTQIRALPEPILAGRQEKGAVAPFSAEIG